MRCFGEASDAHELRHMRERRLHTQARPGAIEPSSSIAPSGADAIVPEVERTPHGICLACGDDLSEPLRRSASLRCHDCRESSAPLNRELVEPAAERLPSERRRRLFRRAA